MGLAEKSSDPGMGKQVEGRIQTTRFRVRVGGSQKL